MQELRDRIAEQGQDIKEVKAYVVELVKQGAIHNQVLIQHEQRSTNLEKIVSEFKRDTDLRIRPIEQAYHFRAALKTLLLGSSGIIGLLLALLALYLKAK